MVSIRDFLKKKRSQAFENEHPVSLPKKVGFCIHWNSNSILEMAKKYGYPFAVWRNSTKVDLQTLHCLAHIRVAWI